MGYSIAIGKLVTKKDDGYTYKTVETVTLENAPAFGEPTDYTNQRWPSYTSWAKAMDFIGLSDVMFNEKTGLMRGHPSNYRIFKKHKKAIDKAYVEFYQKYPNAKAGFSPIPFDPFKEDKNWPEENNWAVRLEWLKFWVDWAFENCEKPYFHNT
jgi:hypothetical protein